MISKKKAVKNITKACKINDIIFKKIIIGLKKGKFNDEKSIADFIKKKAADFGCSLAFDSVIATKENASEIHHKPNNTKLKKGFLVMDFGVKYKGYCSDMTRTIYIGKPSKKDVVLYNLVLEAQLIALDYVSPGVYAADIDLIARAVLWGYFKNFVHGVGHGVGKKIHQTPTLSPKSKAILKKGQIITIEPGLYFKNKLGIRIEDTVLIGKKIKILTKTKKRLIVI